MNRRTFLKLASATVAVIQLSPAVALAERKVLKLPPGIVIADRKVMAELLGVSYARLPFQVINGRLESARIRVLKYSVSSDLDGVCYDVLAECIRKSIDGLNCLSDVHISQDFGGRRSIIVRYLSTCT